MGRWIVNTLIFNEVKPHYAVKSVIEYLKKMFDKGGVRLIRVNQIDMIKTFPL